MRYKLILALALAFVVLAPLAAMVKLVKGSVTLREEERGARPLDSIGPALFF